MVMDLSAEAPNKAAKVAEGFWLVASRHHPGGSSNFPEINNRAAVFQVNGESGPELVVFNAIDPACIDAVKGIEAETGTKVRAVVSPGGGHHLLMRHWYDAFEEAECLLCPVRAPNTANGKELMKLERMGTLDLDAPLAKYTGQLEVVELIGSPSGFAEVSFASTSPASVSARPS